MKSTRQRGKEPEPRFLIYCGNEAHHFRYNQKRLYRESEIRKVIVEAMSNCRRCSCPTDVALGLVIEDAQGNLWEPRVQVAFVPYTPEETDET